MSILSPPEILVAAEKMRRAKTAILLNRRDSSLADIVQSDRDAFSGLRLLYASDVAGVPLQEFTRSDHADVHLANPFCGRGFLAFSDEIHELMVQGEAPLRFITRAVLDTNFLSALPRFFTGEDLSNRDEVGRTLEFIDARLGKSFDWTFASLENLREALKQNNPYPYRKVAAIKRYCDTPDGFHADQRWTTRELDPYLMEAEAQWLSWLRSPAAWHILIRRDLVYAVTLKAFLECWRGSDTQRALANVISFCLDTFGLMPLLELYFGWHALVGLTQTGTKLSVFDEPALKSPRRDSLDRISALAWDLFLFRWCETLMTESDPQTFFVPTLTTLDERLLRTVRECPLRAVLMDDHAGLVNVVFDDELVFHEALDSCLSADLKRRIDDPERRGRREQVSRYALSASICALEKELSKLV